MPRPRKLPPVDGGADLLPAAEAAPAPATPAAKPRKPKAAAAKAAPAEEAGQAVAAKPKAKAKRKVDGGPTLDFESAGQPAAQATAQSTVLTQSQAVDTASDVSKPVDTAPAIAVAASALGRQEQQPERAEPAAAPVGEPAKAVAPAPAEVRYPHRQGPADPPPRRAAPAPIERAPAVERPGPSTPRPLSMAELAERQRQTREMSRAPDREMPVQRPAPVSMQERAMRYRPAEPVSKPVPAAAVEAQADRKGHEDSQARALDAARHKREPVAPGAAPASSAPVWEARGPTGGATVVLVTRNHAHLIENRLRAWREALPEVDLRWAVLDLGSTDATAQRAEEFAGVRLLVRPGGLVGPAAALTAALKALTGDALVLVDVEAEPDTVVEALLRALRAGAAVAVAPRSRVDFLAISRASWEAGGQPPLDDLPRWAAVHGGVVRFGAMVGTERPRSLVQRLCPDPLPPRWDVRRLLPASLRDLLNRFGVLGGAGK